MNKMLASSGLIPRCPTSKQPELSGGAVFPLVLKKNPAARLKLAGANLPAADERNCIVFGYVDPSALLPNQTNYTANAAIIALPVFVRGGVPLKLSKP